MCEISTIIELQGWPLVMCTYHDGEFMPAKAVIFFDKNGGTSTITKFNIDKTKQCFNNKPISPVIKVNERLDDRFLQIGNRVEFVV